MTIHEALARCRTEVQRDADHMLSFASRRRLLRAFGPIVRDARGHAVALDEGKRARVRLARAAASRVAHSWHRELQTNAVEQLLALIDHYLDGAADRRAVLRRTDALTGALENAPTESQLCAWLAGKAAAGAGWVAVGDELLEADEGVTDAELDAPSDSDLWDPACWAACAAAGGTPRSPSYRPADALVFWSWYLDHAASVAIPPPTTL